MYNSDMFWGAEVDRQRLNKVLRKYFYPGISVSKMTELKPFLSGGPLIAEFTGLGGTGKSAGIGILDCEEFAVEPWGFVPFIVEEFAGVDSRTLESVKAKGPFELEALKVQGALLAITAAHDINKTSERRTLPALTFIERGPFDALAWLLFYRQKLGRQMEDQLLARWYEVFMKAAILLPHIDLVIMFTSSQEAIEARRLEAGLSAEGSVINRANRPVFAWAYACLTRFIKRYANPTLGTGLVTIDTSQKTRGEIAVQVIHTGQSLLKR